MNSGPKEDKIKADVNLRFQIEEGHQIEIIDRQYSHDYVATVCIPFFKDIYKVSLHSLYQPFKLSPFFPILNIAR
jgi:hypothetical protein